jgi:hypothetical protein
MIAAAVMILQATASGGAPIAGADPAPHPAAPADCSGKADADDDIVVCSRKDANEHYRLRPLTHQYDPVGGPGIGFRVGPGQGNVYAAQQKSPDGKPDKRIMVTLKMPF